MAPSEDKDEKYRESLVDSGLADVVLIKKMEMEEWTKKQEQLKIDMEQAQAKVETTISDVKNTY